MRISAAKSSKAKTHARSSADKTLDLIDSNTATCQGRWCDIEPLSTEERKQWEAQEDMIDGSGEKTSGREEAIRWEQEQVSGTLQGCWVRAPPCGRCGLPLGTAEAGRERDMSLIFHTVNKMILLCRVNTQPPIVIFPKYTHTCTVTHSSPRGALPGNSMQTGSPPPPLFLSVSHKTTCIPDTTPSMAEPIYAFMHSMKN